MLRLLRNKKAQSTAEYAVLIALVVAAIVGMQTYVKRGLQARAKDASDDYITALENDDNKANWDQISTTAASAETQYEPLGLSSVSTQNVIADNASSTMTKEGVVTRESTRRTQQAQGDKQDYGYTTK